jgi:iron complex outermembrane receptor protein
LSASRLSQPINEAPAAVTVIDKQMIKDSGAWDLSEIFRLVPGMYVAYHADPYFSADSTVAYHGMVTTTTSDRMQVLIDGRSVYSGLFGGVNWSDLPIVLADIERIEVIRGPDSASYGANSYLGVINIITSMRRNPAVHRSHFHTATAAQKVCFVMAQKVAISATV